MEKPAAHWLTFVKHKKTLIVFDSAPPSDSEMRRIGLDDLHVGKAGRGNSCSTLAS